MRYLRYFVYFMLLVLVDYYMSKYVSYNKELVPMLIKSAALLITAFSLLYIEQQIKKSKRKKERT
ncbi:hypothetical protein [Exiguobacterium sp. s80]|uniref:hypothetical protein n=1 Tax=Exiguobacterium sp. s80 TaxID=2751209 RepID=UPI001BEC23BA|nr:hypothetical protein [Exiguobacterium sp. s80]